VHFGLSLKRQDVLLFFSTVDEDRDGILMYKEFEDFYQHDYEKDIKELETKRESVDIQVYVFEHLTQGSEAEEPDFGAGVRADRLEPERVHRRGGVPEHAAALRVHDRRRAGVRDAAARRRELRREDFVPGAEPAGAKPGAGGQGRGGPAAGSRDIPMARQGHREADSRSAPVTQ